MNFRALLKKQLLALTANVVARQALLFTGYAVRKMAEAAGTLSCHRDTLKLLQGWLAWAPVAKHTDIPGKLYLQTLIALRNHKLPVSSFNAADNTNDADEGPASDAADSVDKTENTVEEQQAPSS